MICKEEICSWFKDLESYKRIDIMCALLNMCLPFELRFLGTCLEELGRRDSQELRGVELRVNNAQELASEIALCQTGEPTDKKIRRKMALYLALIRACNRTCVNELFKTLDGWGDRDFLKMTDTDTLRELLLVYSMATNHPVFSFDQRLKCGDIFLKIQENKLINGQQPQQQQNLMSPQLQNFQQNNPLNVSNSVQQHHPLHAGIQVISQGGLPISFPQILPSADGTLPQQITVDGVHHMFPANIPVEFAAAAAAVGGLPNIPWALRPANTYPTTVPPPSISGSDQQSQSQHPPQSSSPMLSQTSSPSHSRTTSPNRSNIATNLIQQQQSLRNQQRVTLRNSRRPSNETTPPPQQQNSIQQTQQHIISLIGNNELIIPQNLKNIDDVLLNPDGTITQLTRNGYTRPGPHTMPRLSKQQPQHHQPQHQQHIQGFLAGGSGPQSLPPNFQSVNAAGITYTLQNMSLIDVHNNPVIDNMTSSTSSVGGASTTSSRTSAITKNTGGNSDSGSSIGSTGDISPPDTPTTRHEQQPNSTYRTRLNGRQEKLIGSGNTGTGATILYAPPQASSPHQFQQLLSNELLLSGQLVQATTINNNTTTSSITTNNSKVMAPFAGNLDNTNSNNNLLGNAIVISSPSQFPTASYPAYQQQSQQQRPPPPQLINPTTSGNSIPFRPPAGFQIQPNGDILYPYPPHLPAGLTFLQPPPPAAPQQTQTISLRSSPSMQPAVATPGIVQPLPIQQIPSPSAMMAASPYTTVVGSKLVSCFNCGSQSHTGRECHEASMEDVTRGAIYKLDYTTQQLISTTSSGIAGSNTSQNSSNNSNSSGSNSNTSNLSLGQQTNKQDQQNIENLSANSSNSSLSK